jgi:hypothetical protein
MNGWWKNGTIKQTLKPDFFERQSPILDYIIIHQIGL